MKTEKYFSMPAPERYDHFLEWHKWLMKKCDSLFVKVDRRIRQMDINHHVNSVIRDGADSVKLIRQTSYI